MTESEVKQMSTDELKQMLYKYKDTAIVEDLQQYTMKILINSVKL
jgi:hypothetical protein